MSLTFTIKQEDYPQIFKLYKRDRTKKLETIFRTGYDIHYPNFEDSNNIEYHTILQSIDEIKNASNNGMNSKFSELIDSIHKLTGINNNSSKRGEVGENMLEEVFKKRYGDIVYDNKAKTPHSGDAWLHLPDKKIIMLESKNYTQRVGKDEVEKMESDMKTNHIKFGVFVSWSSQVQNRKDLDFHTFCHNSETYMVVIISNLGDDIIKLDLGLQIIRELAENFNDIKKFQWLQNDITQSLNELDIIIQKNYKLRDHYYTMSNNIRSCMDNFYNLLRDYQYEINIKVQEIIDKVKNTMANSKQKNKIKNVSNTKLLKEFKKNKKMFPILSSLLDTLSLIENTSIEPSKDNNTFIIYKNKEELGTFKIKSRKVSISLTKLNFNMDLENDKYNESIKILPEICKNI